MVEINPKSPFMVAYDWSNVIKPITNEQLTLWLKTLRSGEYSQGFGALVIEEIENYEAGTAEYCYCCLGVYNDICPISEVTDDAFLTSGYKNSIALPLPAAERYSEVYLLPYDLQEKLANSNDSGTSFEEIADIIEDGFTRNA